MALHWELLSTRELATLECAALGMKDAEIANHLGIKSTSVRTYWARLRSKLGAVSRKRVVVAYKDHVDRQDGKELEMYQAISKYAAVGMVEVKGNHWKIESAGNSFARLLGSTPRELLGADLRKVLPKHQERALHSVLEEATRKRFSVTTVPFGSDHVGVTLVTILPSSRGTFLRIFRSPKVATTTHALVMPPASLKLKARS